MAQTTGWSAPSVAASASVPSDPAASSGGHTFGKPGLACPVVVAGDGGRMETDHLRSSPDYRTPKNDASSDEEVDMLRGQMEVDELHAQAAQERAEAALAKARVAESRLALRRAQRTSGRSSARTRSERREGSESPERSPRDQGSPVAQLASSPEAPPAGDDLPCSSLALVTASPNPFLFVLATPPLAEPSLERALEEIIGDGGSAAPSAATTVVASHPRLSPEVLARHGRNSYAPYRARTPPRTLT
jgi:hypothetical protein